MKLCDVGGCNNPSFGKDKNTGKPYCKSHQYLRSDLDLRPIAVKGLEKALKNKTDDDESLSNLVADADAIFSQYIRLKYADKQGMVSCFTSGVRLHYTKIQCGHFISRKHYGLRWSVDNCRPQSEHDNCYLDGNLKVFAANLEAERPGVTEWLSEQSKEVYKPTISDLKEIISEYRAKVQLLKTKLQ